MKRHGGSANTVPNRCCRTNDSRLLLAVIDITFLLNRKDDEGAAATPSTFDARQKFRQVCCGRAVTWTPSKLDKYFLKLGRTCHDDPHVDNAEIEEQPEIIEVTIIERIFVVPLDFKGDLVLVTIDGMCWRWMRNAVHRNLCVERFLAPSLRRECSVDLG